MPPSPPTNPAKVFKRTRTLGPFKSQSAPDVAQLDAISHEEVQATRRARANACKNDLSSKLEWDDAVAISEWNETWEAVHDFYHLDRVIQ
jgi:hypothetical protein